MSGTQKYKILSLVLFTSLCMTVGLEVKLHAQTREPWRFPDLQHSISIRDGRTSDRLTWEKLLDELSFADIVFLGEMHDDDATHELQLALYNAMLERRKSQVVLAMEMFERDVQPHLDAYLSGEIDEGLFLERARPWGNYQEAYRPLVERARELGKPVIASNFPRPLRIKLMQAGDQGLDALGDSRSLAPQTLLANSDLYWKRTDNATRGHAAFMPTATSDRERLMSTQSLWDNSMGEACVNAIDANPGHQVVHLNGGFHSEYWDGTVGQVRQRRPDLHVKTVAIRAVSNPQAAKLRGAPVADFVVYVEDRAKNLRDGQRHVVVASQQSYSLYMPSWASANKPAPLLIWLGDDGLTAEDGLTYWKLILGDTAAIAVLQPLHVQQERDLSLGGRWFWPDRFAEDTATTLQAVERLWQYVLNRFPVDDSRVVLAGEGTGGTMAIAATLLTNKMTLNAVGWSPRQYAKLKDFPLPLLENWGDEIPPPRKLTVMTSSAEESWWNSELAAYQTVGIESTWQAKPTDPWEDLLSQIRNVRTALGLPPVDNNFQQKKYLVPQFGTNRERHWLRLLAFEHGDASTLVTVVDSKMATELPAEARVDYDANLHPTADGTIPLCPGAFGGTTVLVLTETQAKDSLADWLKMEAEDPLTKRSRFHRLRIAVATDGERRLDAVLQKLHDENRKNVLIVPATFYAGDEFMRQLEKLASPLADHMTLHWLPGVGGRSP
ncbi:MAG TPA: ChaN family lipoprotein [Pirellulaceae bacterium]|nr:ChaN family lipoprotein [Pirellulaceae bacterium]HMO92758.1 ChaN family lipoprotein [Pirellulaceae bacterium]HMP69340.1 ChaN family lipoprotein [Pirellulaceae bacterium]